MAADAPARLESDTLYDVVAVIASTPQLEPVLDGVVGVLTRATACHACFIYLRHDDMLVVRAASPVYSHLAGRIQFPVTEGLVGWVVQRNTPAFIRENAQDDPRTNFIAELEEEHFQSMVAVPIPSRDQRVLGAVVLHTVAPREFDEQTLAVLGHVASMIAGAIENAQLYEQAEARVASLTALTALTQQISAAPARQDVVDVVERELPGLVDGLTAHFHEPDTDASASRSLMGLVQARRADSIPDSLRERLGLPTDTVDVLALPLTSGVEHHGLLVVAASHRFAEEAANLVGAVANHMALALNKADLIERLSADTAVRDLFAALDDGLSGEAQAKAHALRLTTGEPLVAVQADLAAVRETALAEQLEALLRRFCRRVVAEISHTSWRALVSVRPENADALDSALREVAEAEKVVIGRSTLHATAATATDAVREAGTAVRAGDVLFRTSGGLATFEHLGAYRYLVHVSSEDMRNDAYLTAVRVLQEYDRRRASHLVRTLEEYLANRRGIVDTARALTVHPNTLRQRLERIEKLTDLDLGTTDLLALEIAVKLAQFG